MTRRTTVRPRRLALEALEDRSVPAVGTFVENFSSDTNPSQGGFDTAADRLHIRRVSGYNDSFVPTPTGVGSPPPGHSLQLGEGGNYAAQIFKGNGTGDYKVTERATAASIKVRGPGTVTFHSLEGGLIAFDNTAPATDWVTFSVHDKLTTPEYTEPFGEFTQVFVNAQGVMLIDDLTVTISGTNSQARLPVVRVHRFGNGLGIVGDNKDNAVRVELLEDGNGTVRVSGVVNGTAVNKVTAGAGATQVDDYTVEVRDFTYVVGFGFAGPDDRDILINLNGGFDLLQVVGRSASVAITDLLINMGAGDSQTELTNLYLGDLLLFKSAGGKDTVGVYGESSFGRTQISTGAGNDAVLFGQPGADVFAGEDPGPVNPNRDGEELARSANTGVRTSAGSFVNTGSGNDTVKARGGRYDFIRFELGTGVDTIRFESAVARWSVVIPGAGNDYIEFIQSNLYNISLHQQAGDVLRLRDIVVHVGYRISLVGGNQGVRVELPDSGLRLKEEDRSRVWLHQYDRTQSLIRLKDDLFVQVFGLNLYHPIAVKSSISFANTDF